MFDLLIGWRNYVMGKKYKWILKPIFFQIDPEKIHDWMAVFLRWLGKFFIGRKIAYFCWGYSNKRLEQNILGINFKNPVGLSAGFDKNATLTNITPSLGFGFTEVGSITGNPCQGNPKPRLWRLKKSKSLAVYYGLANDGCENISKRLKDKKFGLPVGINIAKTNCRATADTQTAILDYFKAYEAFKDVGDYVTINISCPNAYGGEPFTGGAKLEALLGKIMSVPKTKPIFLKISPDLSERETDEIIAVALRFKIDGFVCTNLTKNRNNKNIVDKFVPEKGGFSGKVLDNLSDDLIRYVYKKINGPSTPFGASSPVIIGSGGVFSAEDAYRKIKLGASLIELMTGMIYEGPQLISDINLGLVKLLKKDGYKNISEAVGKE
ncbi:dihydroorotate dehydrogenase (quinone) [Candidatus Nomurabacteria bacterium RIFOXYC2_FULL_43_16]|uniref:Dihydroorotate dehydrogenase (quinone) n=2 Tax=Candidatus Nomuraibacteriota TaxID=1752729 RepID=A0A1F6YMR5_9BACT|nr:MAG: Dihydroorotate dehydrogenase 2 [Candidatus Nomurabacteria bacterium GW2011_GWF1_42_40]KKT06488.1 MAG: Dihydroorotate dehydrogenase 2 [Candidatus Nomurabacteria bacterium GW2011_GWB1_43_19]KKT11014.1 MAG: Dihydroorotate dehydrogenase 2 [Candidatus Nomurabacteria bacterium GW2011_GWF2_43_24]KKT18271.1 MAG: Dihydroorotate dehydrogenase 2 [Candidatus Nomurabacteria bacterium GW2011_GWA2_43_66]OGJ05227.1 MAG: dihydroorotate dehydrogenase (quinone) [Candidatus Nomurabacteria bacterium RIFOXYB